MPQPPAPPRRTRIGPAAVALTLLLAVGPLTGCVTVSGGPQPRPVPAGNPMDAGEDGPGAGPSPSGVGRAGRAGEHKLGAGESPSAGALGEKDEVRKKSEKDDGKGRQAKADSRQERDEEGKG
ncbi:hypothetical protein GL263_27025, partial [Streptomyces durbertensis]|nr:hypothetical protein [Streptomyces durbertensis]